MELDAPFGIDVRDGTTHGIYVRDLNVPGSAKISGVLLVSIDGVDVRNMSAAGASRLMMGKATDAAKAKFVLKSYTLPTLLHHSEGKDAESPIFQHILGLRYYYGDGVAKNATTAVGWYQKAADAGDPRAQFNLGRCYKTGTGVEKNAAAAVSWFQRAADAGDAGAQFSLGICYKNGTGVEKNATTAVGWYQKAADAGDPRAQFNLGRCYEYGTGVEKVATAAVGWYRKAADTGHARAQSSLGFCYDDGTGVEKDATAAVGWFQKAADAGLAGAQFSLGCAQFSLGVCYTDGTGVAKDAATAVKWFAKASENGVTEGDSGMRSVDKSGRLRRKNAAVQADKAKSSINNVTLRSKMAEHAERMVQLHAGGKLDEALVLFREMKLLATGECTRLAGVTEDCRKNYAGVEERWKFIVEIENVESMDESHIQPDTGGGDAVAGRTDWDTEVSYVDRLLMRSAWAQPTFERLMRQLESTFNANRHPLAMPGITKEEFGKCTFLPYEYRLPGRPGQNCHLKCGPLKSRQRSLDKVKEYMGLKEARTHLIRPAGRYLIDTLRATFCFEDPFAMAVFFELLSNTPGIRIVRVKNKLVNAKLKSEEQTTILINVEINQLDPTGLPLMVEVQLMFQDYLDIKKALHKFYQIIRANNPAEVLTPIFPVLLKSSGLLTKEEEVNDKEVQTLREQLESALVAGHYDEVARLARQLKMKTAEMKADPLATFSTSELSDQRDAILHLADRTVQEHGGTSAPFNNALYVLDEAVARSTARDTERNRLSILATDAVEAFDNSKQINAEVRRRAVKNALATWQAYTRKGSGSEDEVEGGHWGFDEATAADGGGGIGDGGKPKSKTTPKPKSVRARSSFNDTAMHPAEARPVFDKAAWEAREDPVSKRTYYVNKDTQETMWGIHEEWCSNGMSIDVVSSDDDNDDGGGYEHDYVNTNDGGSSTLRDEYMTVAVSGSDDGDDDDDFVASSEVGGMVMTHTIGTMPLVSDDDDDDDDGGADGDYDKSTIAGTPFNK